MKQVPKTKQKKLSPAAAVDVYTRRAGENSILNGVYIYMKNGERENGFPIYVTNIQTQKRPKRNKNLEIKKGKEKRIA
jgi:hypothetical protein